MCKCFLSVKRWERPFHAALGKWCTRRLESWYCALGTEFPPFFSIARLRLLPILIKPCVENFFVSFFFSRSSWLSKTVMHCGLWNEHAVMISTIKSASPKIGSHLGRSQNKIGVSVVMFCLLSCFCVHFWGCYAFQSVWGLCVFWVESYVEYGVRVC